MSTQRELLTVKCPGKLKGGWETTKTYNCTALSVPSILKHFLYTCHVQSSYKMAPSRSTPAGIEIESYVTFAVGNIQHINILAWCELCIFRYKWLPSTAIILNFFGKPRQLSTNSSNCSTKLPTSSNSHPSHQQSGLEPEVQGRFCWQLRPNPTCSRRVLHPNATPKAWLASPLDRRTRSNEGKSLLIAGSRTSAIHYVNHSSSSSS